MNIEQVRQALRELEKKGLVEQLDTGNWRLTEFGRRAQLSLIVKLGSG
jgi:Mn-dependent DtxR family transcriptional regulator